MLSKKGQRMNSPIPANIPENDIPALHETLVNDQRYQFNLYLQSHPKVRAEFREMDEDFKRIYP